MIFAQAGYRRNFHSLPPRLMLSGELGMLLTMYEMEAQFEFTPGEPVARVKASDLKAMWKLLEDVKALGIQEHKELWVSRLG
jgi:hypothetical protein